MGDAGSAAIADNLELNAGGAGCNEVLDNGNALISSPGMGTLIYQAINAPALTNAYRATTHERPA